MNQVMRDAQHATRLVDELGAWLDALRARIDDA